MVVSNATDVNFNKTPRRLLIKYVGDKIELPRVQHCCPSMAMATNYLSNVPYIVCRLMAEPTEKVNDDRNITPSIRSGYEQVMKSGASRIIERSIVYK